MTKLLDYIVTEPLVDDQKKGHKFPYNACEVLASENVFVIDKYFEQKEEMQEKDEVIIDSQTELLTNENNVPSSNTFGRSSILFDQNFGTMTKSNKEENEEIISQGEEKANINTNDENMNDIKLIDLVNDIKQAEEIETHTENLHNENKTNFSNGISEIDFLESKEDTKSETEQIPPENNNNTTKTNYPLINYLFSMLPNSNNTQLNYILAGYFNKLFTHLLNFRKDKFLNYLTIERPELTDRMINNLSRKSISDCLLKLLSTFSTDESINEIKKDILLKILVNFDWEDDEKCDNTLELISDLLQNRRIYYLIARNRNLLDKLFLLCKTSLDKSHQVTNFKIVNKFIEQVMRDIVPQSDEEEKEEIIDPSIDLFKTNSDSKFSAELEFKNYLDIFEVIYENLEPIVNDFILTGQIINEKKQFKFGSLYLSHCDSFNSTFEKENKCLGLTKIYQLEFFKLILELITHLSNAFSKMEIVSQRINKIIDIITDSDLFTCIYKFFFYYEMNNLYQNTFESLIVFLACKSTSEKLVNYVFQDFPDEIISHLFLQGIEFRSGNWILPGYYATLCNVAYKINTSENVYLTQILEKNESPFQKLSNETTENDSNSFKYFAQIQCARKFETYKEKRNKILKEGGTFDVDLYLKEEENNKNEDSNLAISIPIGDEVEETKFEDSSLTTSNFNNSDMYNDTYYWKTSKMDFDISELQ